MRRPDIARHIVEVDVANRMIDHHMGIARNFDAKVQIDIGGVARSSANGNASCAAIIRGDHDLAVGSLRGDLDAVQIVVAFAPSAAYIRFAST